MACDDIARGMAGKARKEISTTCVKYSDYASQNTAGVIKIWTSTDSSGEVTLNISTQDEDEVEE